MTDILKQIVANKRVEIQNRKSIRPYSDLEVAVKKTESARGFYFALEEKRKKR